MSWEKKDQPVEQPVDETITEEVAVEQPAPKRRGRPRKAKEAPAAVAEQPAEPQELQPQLDTDHNVSGVHRGRYRFAAWIGLVVILFAIIGVIAVVVLGVNLIRNATDQTDLMTELHDFAYPISYYQPTAFDELEEADSDKLLLAAVYKITKAEEVRQLRENTGEFSYDLDEEARLIIPTETITKAYKTLFGQDAEPVFNTIGSDSQSYAQFFYDKENNCMHVPWIYSTSSSLYVTVADDIRLRSNTARVRIGYVLQTALGYDDFGNRLQPTAEQASYFQWYVFQQDAEDNWYLIAVEGEPTAGDSTTVSTTTTTTTGSTTTTTAGTTTTAAG